MKAITLHQPWASLIASGAKTSETRSWAPPAYLIGERFVIHASKKKPGYATPIWSSNALHALRRGGIISASSAIQMVPHHGLLQLPRGAAVCSAVLDYAFKIEYKARHKSQTMAVGYTKDGGECMTRIDPWGDFSVGRWVWKLSHINVLPEPVPCKGAQRIWEWPL